MLATGLMLSLSGCGDGSTSATTTPAANTAPVANAGADRRAVAGVLVNLSGAASSDAEGNALTYLWYMQSIPVGSGATLFNPTTVAPSFAPGILGSYVMQLIVNDGQLDSVASTVTITVSCDPAVSTCVTIGVYTISNGLYVDTNKDLLYTVGKPCETWARTAQPDFHNTVSHLHYNAQDASTYIGTTMTWFEYGADLTQASIDATCAAGVGGVQKTADLNVYTPDKNFFVKIKSVL